MLRATGIFLYVIILLFWILSHVVPLQLLYILPKQNDNATFPCWTWFWSSQLLCFYENLTLRHSVTYRPGVGNNKL